MLRDRAKQKAKSRVKSKAKSAAKQKVRQAAADDGGPKVLKAAAVGGTAYYAGNKVHEKRHPDEAETHESTAASEPTSAAGTGSDTVAQLQQLAQLHDSGALTDEEFTSAKQRILTGG